jgi:hypothetical protein
MDPPERRSDAPTRFVNELFDGVWITSTCPEVYVTAGGQGFCVDPETHKPRRCEHTHVLVSRSEIWGRPQPAVAAPPEIWTKIAKQIDAEARIVKSEYDNARDNGTMRIGAQKRAKEARRVFDTAERLSVLCKYAARAEHMTRVRHRESYRDVLSEIFMASTILFGLPIKNLQSERVFNYWEPGYTNPVRRYFDDPDAEIPPMPALVRHPPWLRREDRIGGEEAN